MGNRYAKHGLSLTKISEHGYRRRSTVGGRVTGDLSLRTPEEWSTCRAVSLAVPFRWTTLCPPILCLIRVDCTTISLYLTHVSTTYNCIQLTVSLALHTVLDNLVAIARWIHDRRRTRWNRQ